MKIKINYPFIKKIIYILSHFLFFLVLEIDINYEFYSGVENAIKLFYFLYPFHLFDLSFFYSTLFFVSFLTQGFSLDSYMKEFVFNNLMGFTFLNIIFTLVGYFIWFKFIEIKLLFMTKSVYGVKKVIGLILLHSSNIYLILIFLLFLYKAYKALLTL